MPLPLLLDAAPALWTYTTPFLASALAFVVGYIMFRLNRTYTENRESEQSKNQWRDGRLLAEKALADAIGAEARNRLEWQLKREAELASIAGILEESTEAHKLLASIAATTHAHGGRLSELNERLNIMQQHINNLSFHAKP